MSWDCKYKTGKSECRRLSGECRPGDKGCVLYGKYVFPFKDEKKPDTNSLKKEAEL
ncbi:MAG: hypothetical protein HN368_11020 [Spirochaetales bacterium]|jgi:hypothetical protein|nr:hypothetical protein [Spirochaetales bacterium]